MYKTKNRNQAFEVVLAILFIISLSGALNAQTPAAPVLVSPANGNTGVSLNPVLSWNAPQYATTYRVQVSKNSQFSSTELEAGVNDPSTSFNVLPNVLSPFTLYYWRVQAYNGNYPTGSDWSEVWSFTTQYTLSFSGAQLNIREYILGGTPTLVSPGQFAPLFQNSNTAALSVSYDTGQTDTVPADPNNGTYRIGSFSVQIPEIGLSVSRSSNNMQISTFLNTSNPPNAVSQFFVDSNGVDSFSSNVGLPNPTDFSSTIFGNAAMLTNDSLPTSPLNWVYGDVSFRFIADDQTLRQVLITYSNPAISNTAVFQVEGFPFSTVADTNNTATAGDIVFALPTGTSPTTNGTIRIAYPVPITVPFNSITVTGTGGFAGLVSLNTGLSSNAGGILVVNVPGGVSIAGDSIRVSGVRLGVAGSQLSPIYATVTSTGNSITPGQGTIAVITNVAPGIASIHGVAGEIDAGTGAVTASPWVGVEEGFMFAFDRQSPGDTMRVLVRFKLDAPPPSGVTVTFPAQAVAKSGSSESVWKRTDSVGNSLSGALDITSGSTDLSVYYKTNTTISDPSFFNKETLSVPVKLTVSGGAVLAPGTGLTYTASLAPVGNAFDSYGGVIVSPIPRFAESPLGSATLFSVTFSPGLPLSPISEPLNPGGGSNAYPFSESMFNLRVTYDPFPSSGTDVNMIVQPVLISQQDLDEMVAGSSFEGATLVPYEGTGGLGVLFRVTCEDGSHIPVPCPAPVGDYDIKTAWSPTSQTIAAPAFLKAPVGNNAWEDILLSYAVDKIDPTCVGRSRYDYSDFVFVDMGAGAATAGKGTTLPEIAINSPAEGAVYMLNQTVLSDYFCSGADSCNGPVTPGSPIDTASPGAKTFRVVATINSESSTNPVVSYAKTVMYSVKAGQKIRFNPIQPQIVGASVLLRSTASSGLPVSFRSLTGAVCTVSGAIATMTAKGTCSIMASQPGNAYYFPAVPVTRSFRVVSPFAAGFKIITAPQSKTVKRGMPVGFTLVIHSENGFKGKVKLACSGGPAGTKCAVLPPVLYVNGTAHAIAEILFPRDAAPGTYAVTFTGKSDSLTATATAKITVKASGPLNSAHECYFQYRLE
jgi:hypothetical protein